MSGSLAAQTLKVRVGHKLRWSLLCHREGTGGALHVAEAAAEHSSMGRPLTEWASCWDLNAARGGGGEDLHGARHTAEMTEAGPPVKGGWYEGPGAWAMGGVAS